MNYRQPEAWHTVTVEHGRGGEPDYTLNHPGGCEFDDIDDIGRHYYCHTGHEFYEADPADIGCPATPGTYGLRGWEGGLEWATERETLHGHHQSG